MKIDYFHTLRSVLQSGSFAAAAKQMNITPSAISMQMKQLEIYFGAPLFDRSGPQVRATHFAQTVAGTVEPALREIELMRQREHLAIEGLLKVGVIDSLQPTLMPAILSLARVRHSGLELRPLRGRSSKLTEGVQAGVLDAAIVAQPERRGLRRLTWYPLFTTPLIVIAPPASRTTDLARLFLEHSWIRFDRNSETGRMAGRFVAEHRLQTHGEMELQSAQSIFAMVSAGLGASILTAADPRLCMGYPVRTISLGILAPTMQMSLALRPGDVERRNFVALRSLCEDAARSRDASITPPVKGRHKRKLRA